MKYVKISWDKLEKDCISLVNKLGNKKFDRIICISRGGLPWARVLSDFLKLPISHLAVESYADLKQIKRPVVTESPKDLPRPEKWLVVDDVSDTGDTFALVVEHLKKYRTKKIFTVSPYIKPKTKFIPDFYVESIDAWIIFPYEIRETYEAFLKIYKTSKKAKQMLLKNGLKNWEIENL
ncbi:MAG: Purine phosphoribosyltransferase [Candidatus Roizmanbacteria bacterium GW2011_GWA2_35_19]|uniref:Purine phosphoribosyltransferase n=2 Tax=Candidatus Roizmaniibacteriota TaxID=1752723 RepID=A0A0G0E832_9BACT|nr:MAG: Purine phosphoribosyltransferase [Candidatus Roizmanbacteria bacterium GW2011_GWC2_35_12]KKP71485.1 MAG: Purine phosphoribosyltransferase [Candidatus Roizmanbacteria bacterium GW2011_GWA2_35_19]